MTHPVDHKTVFVLDHSPYFAESCRQQIEFDALTKTIRTPGIIPLAPICKSMWTCAVEAAMEYCRIVWDIYPKDKLIRFVISDRAAQFLNSWDAEEQNYNFLLNSFAHVGPPAPRKVSQKDCNIMHGLNAAIEALCQCSDVQHEKRTSLTENAAKVINRGRIICITSLKSDQYVRSIEESFLAALMQRNKLAASTDTLIPIHCCELVLMHTLPVDASCNITDRPQREFPPHLYSEVYAIKSGRYLSAKLCNMVLRHCNLASTTVTGIPMKEEQNANSSANYDVELLHPADAHTELVKTDCYRLSGSPLKGAPLRTVKEGCEYETVTLKWCTPRNSAASELQYCTGMFRVTPMDVNSRPSTCLTNFILNGRAVMLEMPRESGSKVMSHMLSSHGGEIFIHTLGTSRSILEDPPSISEGCGGRVTDYRINDFGEFMKSAKLVPHRKVVQDGEMSPVENARKYLERLTRYWPMVISNTTIFNMPQHLEPLLSLIVKETLTDDDVLECKKSIYDLVSMDSRNEALPIPSMGTRGKGPKRDEQYRVLWNELEMLVRAHCTTDGHNKVLDCLLTCHKPYSELSGKASGSSGGSGSTSTGSGRKGGGEKTPTKEEKVDKSLSETEVALKEMEKYNKMTEREKSDFNRGDSLGDSVAKVKRSDSPPLKCMKLTLKGSSAGPQSLLTLWTNRINAEHSKRHAEFSGRLTAEGNIAKLYASLEENQDGEIIKRSVSISTCGWPVLGKLDYSMRNSE